MFDSAVLELAIGMVFVYLLVALVCSAIGDKISQMLNWRAHDLEQGIRDILLGGKQETIDKLYASFHVQPLMMANSRATSFLKKIPLLSKAVYARQNIPQLKSPIKMSAQTFAVAFLDAVTVDETGQDALDKLKKGVNNLPDSPFKKAILPLVTATDAKVDSVRLQLETWFKLAEDQMTMVYRQNMWWIALVIGFIVSVFFNVDTVSVATSLWRDPTLRSAVVAQATEYAKQTPSAAQPNPVEKANEQLNKLNLPLGWQVTGQANFPFFSAVPNDWAQAKTAPDTLRYIGDLLLKLLGWVITGVAGAQGAPFWFDVLRKLTNPPKTSSAS